MLKMQSSARRKAYITAMKLLMGVAAVLTCALVVGMIGYILGNGIPNITWEMLSTAPELSCQPRRHPAGHPEHALHRHRDAFNRAAARRGRGHLLK